MNAKAKAYRDLVTIFAGVVIWSAVRSVSPKAAGYILAAIVIGALITIGPYLAKIGE